MLDTTMLSVMMTPEPVRKVADWILGQPSDELFTAAVCQAEVLSGIAILPTGRRRTDLEVAAQAMFAEDFQGRVLPFDPEAATAYAEVFAARRAKPAGLAGLSI